MRFTPRARIQHTNCTFYANKWFNFPYVCQLQLQSSTRINGLTLKSGRTESALAKVIESSSLAAALGSTVGNNNRIADYWTELCAVILSIYVIYTLDWIHIAEPFNKLHKYLTVTTGIGTNTWTNFVKPKKFVFVKKCNLLYNFL